MNGRRGGEDLAVLIERSAELKRDLVDFACSPRLERSLAAAMLEAGLEEIDEGDAISTIDRFALQYRLPDGQTVVDRFVASRPDLDAADREMLLGWRDPVEGIFEIRGRDGDAIILLNLLDDLEYRTYSNMGRAVFRSLPRDGFVHARLVPIRPVPGAWLVSGTMSSYRKSDAGWLAKVALELATKRPELVFRNPEKVEQGWRQMREDRAGFVAFFGGDELVLPPGEAEERLNAYYRHRQEAALARRPARRRPPNLPGLDVPAFEFPPGLATPTPSASSTTRSTGSTSITSTGCCGTCSATRRSQPTSDTRTCCAATCGRRRSRRCRCSASPPPTRTRWTRCSGRSCAGGTSPGPSTARR